MMLESDRIDDDGSGGGKLVKKVVKKLKNRQKVQKTLKA